MMAAHSNSLKADVTVAIGQNYNAELQVTTTNELFGLIDRIVPSNAF